MRDVSSRPMTREENPCLLTMLAACALLCKGKKKFFRNDLQQQCTSSSCRPDPTRRSIHQSTSSVCASVPRAFLAHSHSRTTRIVRKETDRSEKIVRRTTRGGKKKKELATQTCEQARQARRQQEELVAQRLEQERQTRIEQERKIIRKQEEQAKQREEQEKREKEHAHEEVKRLTRRYKFNIATKLEKKRFKKTALTEAVFVLEPEIATEYRRLRQEAAQLMHQYGPFSASATAAHAKFEVFNEGNLMWQLPSMGLEYEKESGRIVWVE